MKKNFKSILLITNSVVLFIISFLLFYKSINNYTQDIIKYKEESTIDYKVYLKENNYFDSPYLEENKAYITSLIDYIDVDFNYNMEFDSNRSGKYVYYVKGIMGANVNNSKNDYWQKTYDLIKVNEVTYNDLDKINFLQNVKIDYQKYNDLLLSFKEEFKLSFDGYFKVILYVENYVESSNGYELKEATTLDLEIPLTKATIEVPITVGEEKVESLLTGDLIYSKNKLYTLLKILSIISLLGGLVLLTIGVFRIVRSLEKVSAYNKELKKILKTYDGIIVNIGVLPNYSKFNLIDVNSFNELLDAHGEIRQPISFYESKNKAIFILINGNIMWRYILVDEGNE